MTTHQAQRWVYFFGQGQADASSAIKHLVGGKGASLADMTRAGLNVPPGFTIATECCDLFYKNAQHWPEGLLDEIRANLQRLEETAGRPFGGGANPLLVAVRSGAAQSMPGMMDTILNVGLNNPDLPTEPWDMLEEAIRAVFRSWNSERAVAYRKHYKIDGLLGTAVTVQMMCPAEVAGVLFTANPVNPALEQMILESSYGLGEAVVLGKVTPDRFVLAKTDLAILERNIGSKDKIVTTLAQDGFGQTGARDAASLTDDQVLDLARLGRRVEDYFGHPCDIEWALSQGQFFLLQARAIKYSANKTDSNPSPTATERAQVRGEEIDALQAKTAPGGTVWGRFNLAEILPEPTPMTWAIVRRFMSGRGGFGLMYRDLGFDPDPALAEDGIFDLICGRPYCNLSREPRMQYRDLPFEHKFEMLKANPAKALYPQATLNPARAGWRFWLFVPLVFVKVWRSSVRVRRLTRTFAAEFQDRIVPAYLKEVDAARAEDLGPLASKDLLDRLNHWIKRTLVDFARESLKPTALAGIAMGNLERVLAQRYQPPGTPGPKDDQPSALQQAQAALRSLVMGVKPALDADLPGAIRDLAAGRMSRPEFLRRFGHRGSQEMELAKPRWSEDPDAVGVARTVGVPPAPDTCAPETPTQIWDRLASELKLLPNQRHILEAELATVHTYVALREAGKHHLLRGYALLRRYLVELDQRWQFDDGIFFLTPDELPRLADATPNDPRLRAEMGALIERRRRRRAAALSLPVPQVLFSDDLEAIGRDVEITSADMFQGVPLSAGTVEGPAWVLSESTGAVAPDERYILVCPSTDPAWVPLFVGACGLIMETGGVLSHGAIVAREFGLPAVAGIADVHRRLKTGQRLRLDGGTGVITLLS